MAEAEPTDDGIYREDALRLGSFRTWPNNNITRESLAVAGFYYVNGVRGETGDKVRCAWCSGELENWLFGVCPITEHIRHFPDCIYAKKMAKSNSITLSQSCNEELLQNNPAELGIINHGIPKMVHESFESRLDTFLNWPRNHFQKPESLASAGFYYIDRDDEVRCFQCNVGLSKWEPNDDPWVEHAKYSPTCEFVILRKGRKFAEDPFHYMNNHRNNNNNNRSTIHSVTDADIENCMGSSCAIDALRCGLQPDRIRRAIRIRLNQTGTPFASPDDLIDATLNEQINETSFSIPEAGVTPHVASSSSARYNVDDAAIDLVTRMIINSALMGDEQSNSISSNLQEAHDSDNSTIDLIENIENLSISQHLGEIVDAFSNNVTVVNYSTVSEDAQMQEMKKASAKEPISLEEENKLLKDARTCKICMDLEVSVVFLPCGHLVSCSKCATNLIQCPICRANVKGIVRTYLS